MSAEVAIQPLEDVCTQMMCSSPQPSPQPRAKVLREDLLKILDPSRKKLSSLETQRIAGVLEDCIARVETVAVLPAVLARLGGLSVGLGLELEGALQEHQHLGERLEGLGQKLVEGEAGERARAELERTIPSSLRNVLRLLRAHPAATRALRSEAEVGGQGVSEGVRGLVGGLQELQGVLLEKLLTSPAEERQRTRYMQEVSLRHGNNMELVATLEAEVAAAIKDRDAETSKKNEVIRKLKSSLHQMEKISEDFVLRTQQDADKQNQSDAKTSEGRRARMQQEANQLRVQLNNLISENREVETSLRKKKYKVETEIENWILKYDADMGEKQFELEDMTRLYDEEKEELRELEEAYAVLEQEFSQIQEERRLAEERREEEQKELEKKSRAATIIQAYWRGHRVRKAMRGKGKKGSKGKKGKGKKGK
ncbi:dynein regulatory complex protein 10 [Salmo trutta]|uniref:Dynein regulatory complex protein 10 n=1 Tax=Salmo trutta TaxID=8032 RepID=A0A674C6F4_SALTR|nr:dynein regulatory complex protein 10 [Salmo trutta]XP_029618971.1 dynein regulatory complex protein 10 [Salmo trutta]XP_029618972.1 dynein regulatory complex protein 10 [Salmo trutta]